ncbi:MAG: WD40 repeat domain-containing protein [Bryobacteraceae bacterium]|nr:WD40 repeat domain-containing protein [Bryobacteraceae bacterium]
MPIPLALVLAVAMHGETGDRVIQSDSEVTAISFGADGSSLAALCRDSKIRVWNVKSGALAKTWEREADDAAAMFAGPRGQFATIGKDGRIRMRSLADGSVKRQAAGSLPRASRLAAIDGGFLAAAGRPYDGSSENVVRVWNAEGREQYKLPAGLGGVSALAFSPDGKTLVAAAYDTDVRVWSVQNGELRRVIDEMTVSMFELAFSPDGKYLAAAGVDRTIYLWDAVNWKLVRKITGQPEMISALEFSPDSRLIVTGGMNEMAFDAPVKVLLWDASTGRQVRAMAADHRVGAARFSPDGRFVAVADMDKTISIWSVPGH